jgi:hypothetical protein
MTSVHSSTPSAPDGFDTPDARVRTEAGHRLATETKASLKTTEFWVYVVAVAGVLLASFLVKSSHDHLDYFRADRAWFFIVILTVGYLGSRGLSKAGSRERYDA